MAMLKSCLLLYILFSMGNTEVNALRIIVGGLNRVAGRCPTGWIQSGLRCYRHFPQPTDWNTAEKNCQSLGGNLASMQYKTENDWLRSLLPPSTHSWIGANDAVQEGNWVWSDGKEFMYTNWCAGEPNNAGVPENCLEIFNVDARRCWNDVPCSRSLSYICLKNLGAA